MHNILSLIILILLVGALLAVSLLWLKLDHNKSRASDKVKAVVRKPKPGECAHTSSAKMKITSMGDREDYYLCKLCGSKVKASELYYFEKGGI